MDEIAVIPIKGWWATRKFPEGHERHDRHNRKMRYSLIVSIETEAPLPIYMASVPKSKPRSKQPESSPDAAENGRCREGLSSRTVETSGRLLASFESARFLYCWQIGKVFEEHPVDEDVATASLLQENQLGPLIEELDEVEWRIATPPKNQS